MGKTGFQQEKGTSDALSFIESEEQLRLEIERYEAKDYDDLPTDVQADMDAGFVMTDIDDDYQRCKKISEFEFRYKTGSDAANEFGADETIDVRELNIEEMESAVSSYYGTLDKLKEIVEFDIPSYNMLVAECYFEQNLQ